MPVFDTTDAKGLLRAAIRSSNPVVFFENKLLYLQTGAIPEGDFTVAIGRAALRRSGDVVTIVAVGGMLSTVLAAAGELAADGIEVEVIDRRTLVPLDVASVVRSVLRTGRLVTVEEGPLTHGFGAEVVARVVEAVPMAAWRAAPRRVAGRDVPIPYAKSLESAAVPDTDRVAAAVRTVMGR